MPSKNRYLLIPSNLSKSGLGDGYLLKLGLPFSELHTNWMSEILPASQLPGSLPKLGHRLTKS